MSRYGAPYPRNGWCFESCYITRPCGMYNAELAQSPTNITTTKSWLIFCSQARHRHRLGLIFSHRRRDRTFTGRIQINRRLRSHPTHFKRFLSPHTFRKPKWLSHYDSRSNQAKIISWLRLRRHQWNVRWAIYYTSPGFIEAIPTELPASNTTTHVLQTIHPNAFPILFGIAHNVGYADDQSCFGIYTSGIGILFAFVGCQCIGISSRVLEWRHFRYHGNERLETESGWAKDSL